MILCHAHGVDMPVNSPEAFFGERMMPKLTLHFMDGTSESFEVPKPPSDITSRRARLDMFLEGRYVIVEEGSVDNSVLFFPIENIRCIQIEGSSPGLELPPASVRNACRVS